MKRKLFSLFSYILFILTGLSALYMALPQLQALLPGLSKYVVIVTGVTSSIIGSGALAVQSFIVKSETRNKTETNTLISHINDLTERINDVLSDNTDLKDDLKRLSDKVEHNTEINIAHAKAKINNVSIANESRRILDEVLKNEKGS